MSTSSVGRPGKYQRSFGGLVAALVITVVAIGALLGFLGLFRPDVDNRPQAIDYLGEVKAAQDAKLGPVYPTSLPEGWIATGYDFEPGLQLRMLTEDGEFVGIVQEKAPVAELVRDNVDEDATATDIYTAHGSVADAWQGYEDDGGDSAFASEVAGQTVLVYGSAPAAELEDIIDRLTAEPVTR
jgi:hypothetical protein